MLTTASVGNHGISAQYVSIFYEPPSCNVTPQPQCHHELILMIMTVSITNLGPLADIPLYFNQLYVTRSARLWIRSVTLRSGLETWI